MRTGALSALGLISGNGSLLTDLDLTYDNGIILAPYSGTRNTITPTGDYAALVLQGSAGQTTDLLEIYNYSGDLLASISSTGHFVGDGSQLTNITASQVDIGTLVPTQGGTGISSYVVGELLYASGTTILSALAGPTSVVRQFLTSTGEGTYANAPAWNTIQASDLPGGIPIGVLKGAANAFVPAVPSAPGVSNSDYQIPLPDPTGQAGKFLGSDGSNMSWMGIDNGYF